MKTVQQIDEWFASECKQALEQIPIGIIKIAKTNPEHLKTIAKSIALKKCFKVNAVMKYLTKEDARK